MTLKSIHEEFAQGRITKPEYIERMHAEHRRLFEYASYLAGTDIARVEIADGEVVMTTRSTGIRLRVDPMDRRTAPVEILNFGAYEPKDAAMMCALIDPGSTVFDVGANIGYYALLVARTVPGARVHAFEPIPATFERLTGNLALNAMQNVVTYPFALSDRTGEVTFYFYAEGTVNASAANLTDHPGTKQIACRIQKLDDFARERGFDPSFIKCDVEGAELLVFRGGLETLARAKPVVLTEMLRKWSAKFGYHPNELIALFASLGYRCFTARDGRLDAFAAMDEATVETNFFFLHATQHAEQIARLERR